MNRLSQDIQELRNIVEDLETFEDMMGEVEELELYFDDQYKELFEEE